MNFKKRLLALILAFILTVPSGFYASAENADPANTENTVALPLSSQEFQALYAMGMLGEDVASLKQNSTITRAQFIGSLYRVAGYDAANYDASTNPFIDVNAKTAYKDEILYFYNMGIINGTSANTFSPEMPITYPQAAKLILEVCGYKEFTSVKYGTNLDAYVSMAMYINLTKGISKITLDKPLDAEQAVKLLYNAGRTKVVEATGFNTSGDIFYETDESRELFSVRNKLYCSEGILQSNGLVSVLTPNHDEDFATIDGVEYMLGGLNLSEIIGCKVDFFYKSENGYKTLVWVGVSDKNENLVLTADELQTGNANYTMKNIVYRRNKKLQNAKIAPHADIIHNNSLCNEAGLDELMPRMGRITLIDYNYDSVYDTVIVEEFTNIIVTGLVNSLQLISGKYGNSIYLDDYEKVIIYKDGIEVPLTELQAETCLSAIIDRNKNLLILHINGTWSQGKIVSIYKQGEDTFYEFEDKTLQVARNYADIDPDEYIKDEIVIGGTYKYYLDRNGRIADIEMVTDGKLEYSLLIDAARKTGFSAGDDAEVKLLLLNGNIVVATTKEKMKLNGEKNKKGVDLLDYSGLYGEDGAVKEQVVRVAFDNEGKIKELEFATDNLDHEYGYDAANFSLDYIGTHSKVSLGSTPWWGKYHMGSHIKIFVKYTGLDVDEPYGVTDGGRISSTSLNMQLYDCDENMRPAVTYTTMSASGALTGQALVTDVFYKRYDGEMRKYLGLYYGSSYIEYPEFDDGVIPEDIKRGDVVTLNLFQSQITSVTKFLSLADKPEPYATGTFPSSIQFFGYIYGLTTSSVTVLKPDTYSTTHGKLLPIPLFNNVVIPVTIYDVRNDEITRGSWDDLCPSSTPNADGSLPIDANTTMACIQASEHKVYDIILVKY